MVGTKTCAITTDNNEITLWPSEASTQELSTVQSDLSTNQVSVRKFCYAYWQDCKWKTVNTLFA